MLQNDHGLILVQQLLLRLLLLMQLLFQNNRAMRIRQLELLMVWQTLVSFRLALTFLNRLLNQGKQLCQPIGLLQHRVSLYSSRSQTMQNLER